MLKLAILLSCVSVSLCLWGIFGEEQSVIVKGKLKCDGKPASTVRVKLFEGEILKDTELKAVVTGDDGSFEVSGGKKEISDIDAKVNIYHKCNYQGIIDKCYRKVKIHIPKNFINRPGGDVKTFDIGELNLSGTFSGETIDCLN